MAIRLHAVSKIFDVECKDLVSLLGDLGFPTKNHPFASITDEMMVALETHFKTVSRVEKSPKEVVPNLQMKPEITKSLSEESVAPKFVEMSQAASALAVEKPQQITQAPDKAPPSPDLSALSVKSPDISTSGDSLPEKSLAQPFLRQQVIVKEEKKKSGPRPPREDNLEELETNQQIIIIKTIPPKKDESPKKLKKKKLKKLPKGRPLPKKLIQEERAQEESLQLATEQALHTRPTLQEEPEIQKITIPQEVTVNELAQYLHVDGVEIVRKLLSLGVFASLNQRLEQSQVELVGREFSREIVFTDDVIDTTEEPDSESDLKPRSPVVTIMGHVDHGKTSLLDRIRKTRVAEGEFGGITQHIGAYQVKTPHGNISFLDTPGHEAFTAMRAQGAQITDMAILVIAADDGVQPQTVEAIHHAQAAGVPIIVAINKIDKAEANIEKVKQQLMGYNLVAEDWGGKIIMVPVSAKQGNGIDQLLEMILLQAEIMELKANPSKAGRGIIIEARLDKGMGPIATVLMKNGRVQNGDNVICGTCFGRVKALVNDTGARIREAGPAQPVMILGLNEVPRVGDTLIVVENVKFARYVGTLRSKKEREERLLRENRLKLADVFKQMTDGKVKELNIVIKADVQGSAFALKDSLEKLSVAELRVNAIHAGVGGITESDVMLAAASNAIIIGFHVRPAHGVEEIANRENVEIKVFRIIYDAIDAIKLALKGMYDPVYEEETVGKAEVRQVFRIPKAGTIAGSFVLEGKIQRDMQARIIRDGVEIYEGKVSSLKRFKDDVKEVSAGYECGIGITNYNDFHEKDVFETFRFKEVARE